MQGELITGAPENKERGNSMFEGMDEKTARENILAQVSEYCDRFHNQKKEFIFDDIENALKYINYHDLGQKKYFR